MALFVDQFQRADPGVVVVVQRQAAAQGPFLPLGLACRLGEQAAIGHQDQAAGEFQTVIEVDFQPGLRCFAGVSRGSIAAAQWPGSASSLLAEFSGFALIMGVYRKGEATYLDAHSGG